MSYIQLEIEGVKRGLKFNQMALIVFSQMTDTTSKETSLATAGYALFYAGLKANCYVKMEEADFTFEQACDWFDTLKDEQVAAITAAYQETQKFSEALPKVEDDKKKVKKNTGMKR